MGGYVRSMGAHQSLRARVPHDLARRMADACGVKEIVAQRLLDAYHKLTLADLMDGRPVELRGVGTLRVMLRRVTKSRRHIPVTAAFSPRCMFRPTTSLVGRLENVQDAEERYPIGHRARLVDALFDSAHAGELEEDDPRLREVGD